MRAVSICLLTAVATTIAALPAQADIEASANITTQTLPASQYRYTFNLHNTGDTDIATFWYAWDDTDLNFLPSVPQNIAGPSGWYGFPTYNYTAIAGYTYGIEWYNYSGSPLGAGNSLSGFSFETTDSPAVLAGISNVPPVNPEDSAFPVGTSFVYMNYPAQQPGDPGFQFVVAPTVPVPEPASLSVLGVGLAGLLLRRGRGMEKPWPMANDESMTQ